MCVCVCLLIENGHASVIEILADKFKASIWERTKDGSTLMHIASLNGHAECATMLFKKGVYLHMPNKRGARSIHTAARYGHIGIINTLIQRGEKVDVTTNVSYEMLQFYYACLHCSFVLSFVDLFYSSFFLYVSALPKIESKLKKMNGNEFRHSERPMLAMNSFNFNIMK